MQIPLTIVPRREIETVVALVKEFNPRAFYSIEEVGFVKEGVFPERKDWGSARLLRFLWPLRKGK